MMKAKLPKPYLSLPKADREKVNSVAREIALEIIDAEMGKQLADQSVLLQKRWLQLSCIALNGVGKWGKTRLLGYLVAWKRLYNKIGKMSTDEEVERYLADEMQRIFGPGGYPYEWIEELAKPKDEQGENAK